MNLDSSSNDEFNLSKPFPRPDFKKRVQKGAKKG
jgi:hypothetical protein